MPAFANFQWITLVITFHGIEGRLVNDERVLVTCRLRFVIHNIVLFHAHFVRRDRVYSILRLRKRLDEIIQAVVREFLRDRILPEVESSQQAREQLEVALEQELRRPVHGLTEAGLEFKGLVSWQVTSPAVTAARSITDQLDEEYRVLEAEREGLRRLLTIWQDVQHLRDLVPSPVGRGPKPAHTTPSKKTPQYSWRFPPEDASKKLGPIRSRPAVHGHRVYVAEQEGLIHCLDLATGTPCEAWQPPKLPDEIYGGLTVVEQRPGLPVLLVPCLDGKLYAVHPESGKTLWSCPTEGRLRSAPLVAHGWIYLGCAAGARWGGVVAFRLGDGKEMGRWQAPSRRGVLEAPVVDDESRNLYFGSLDDNGETVYCAQIVRSGDAKLVFKTEGPVKARLILDPENQCLYVATYGGVIYAVSFDGAELWKRNLGETIVAAGALDCGIIYVGTEGGTLYALDVVDKGANIWPPFRTQGPIVGTPVVHEGLLFFGSKDGNVYALDTATGELRNEFVTGGEVLAPLVITDTGALLVGCGSQKGGFLLAIPKDFDRIA